jgi:hypothetical protein
MSIQLALLKSGEEVIADIKEFRDSEEQLVSYLFKDPHCVKINTSKVLMESEESPKHEVIFYKWMSLSKDTDIIVNKDWVVCIVDPLEVIEESYSRRTNGGGSESASGSNGGGDSDSNSVLSESVSFTE